MTNQIIEKLNHHISVGFTKEADVTYLLVQLGKLIERERPGQYSVVRFYRNWVAHEKLDRPNANPSMRAILDSFETLLAAVHAGGNIAGHIQQIADNVSLKALRRELDQLLDDLPFNRKMVGNPSDWQDFVPKLLEILTDIDLQADGTYQYLETLKVNGATGELVITPKAALPICVPLTT